MQRVQPLPDNLGLTDHQRAELAKYIRANYLERPHYHEHPLNELDPYNPTYHDHNGASGFHFHVPGSFPHYDRPGPVIYDNRQHLSKPIDFGWGPDDYARAAGTVPDEAVTSHLRPDGPSLPPPADDGQQGGW